MDVLNEVETLLQESIQMISEVMGFNGRPTQLTKICFKLKSGCKMNDHRKFELLKNVTFGIGATERKHVYLANYMKIVDEAISMIDTDRNHRKFLTPLPVIDYTLYGDKNEFWIVLFPIDDSIMWNFNSMKIIIEVFQKSLQKLLRLVASDARIVHYTSLIDARVANQITQQSFFGEVHD
jgi:hypothetical protein